LTNKTLTVGRDTYKADKQPAGFWGAAFHNYQQMHSPILKVHPADRKDGALHN